MSEVEKPKFNIGDTIWWVYSSTHHNKAIPCPMCFGKKRVGLVLGDGSFIEAECEMCTYGIERASGTATTWEPVAIVKSGQVSGVFRDHEGWRYEASHERLYQWEVFGSPAAAEVAREAAFHEVSERAATWHKDNFVQTTKKQIWSAGYHRNRIKDHERQIEWHRARLCMIAEKSKEPCLEQKKEE